jgi:hypothetical protein
MPVGLRIVLISTMTVMHSLQFTMIVLMIAYATSMTQTPHPTKNKTKNIKNARLNMLFRYKQRMQILERLLVLFARWCVKFFVVKKANQKSEAVDEEPNCFYCQPAL